MTGIDAMEAFAEIVIDLAWAAVACMAVLTIVAVIRALVRGRITARKS